MEAYLATIFSFPTVVYTVFLGVVLCYWLLSIVGLLELDPFDFDLDIDASDLQGFAGLMVTLGLTGVPFPIVLGVLALYGWVITYLASAYILLPMFSGIVLYIAGFGVIAIAFAASIILTARSIRPLKPLFRKAYGAPSARKIVIGQTGVIRSGSVNESFGEAEVTIEGAHLILKVRGEAEQNFKRGDRVVFIKHHDSDNTFWVIHEKDFTS